MNHGTRPTYPKRKDWDYIKTEHPLLYAGIAPAPTFPSEFYTDAGFPIPSQNAEGQPFGCTNYSQAQLATNLMKVWHDPKDLEAITHANTKGGYDITASLDACLPPKLLHPERLGWIGAHFNIDATGKLDYTDAFKLAQVSGGGELRSITWGTPWFPSWERACNPFNNPSAIMPMPTDEELANIRRNLNAYPWHNSVLDGYGTDTGQTLYRDASWQGNTVGKHGFVYFTRDVINVVQNLKGTVARIPAAIKPGNPKTIDLNLVQWIMSHWRSLLGYTY